MVATVGTSGGGMNASVAQALADHRLSMVGATGAKGLIKNARTFSIAVFASMGGLIYGYNQAVSRLELKKLKYKKIASQTALDDAIHEAQTTAATKEANAEDDECVNPVIQHTLVYPKGGKAVIEFPPHELIDPSVTNSVPPKAWRWRFEQVLDAEVERRACGQFRNILCAQGIADDRADISFPPATGKERYVQIFFHNEYDYHWAVDSEFNFNHKKLTLAYSAAPISKRRMVFKVSNVLIGEDQQAILGQICAVLDNYMTVDNIWRLDLATHLSDESKSLEKGPTIIGIATYKPHPHRGFWEAADVPSWVKTQYGIYALHLHGCELSCTNCRDTKQKPYYHSTSECMAKCNVCKKKGHAGINCTKYPAHKHARSLAVAGPAA